MPISRRDILMVLAAGALRAGNPAPAIWRRRYRVSAAVTLLSIPVVTRKDVGSGFTVIEESDRGVAIRFGAGSWPESARGLNRLGFIEETLIEKQPGQLAECSYFAFMTTSEERNTEQAMRALQDSGPTIPYVAAAGAGRDRQFASKVSRVDLPSQITWRDYPGLTGTIRAAIARAPDSQCVEKRLYTSEAAPATFLYAVRRAMLTGSPRTSGSLLYNGKEFLLHTDKENDPAMGVRVMRMNARLHDCTTGVNTPFKLWYEAGSERQPPLRFEYQAKSFLRLTFEYDPVASESSSGMNKEGA